MTERDPLEGFSSLEVSSDDTTIYARSRGEGPPICLLHGFPQTHVMWRRIAPALARQFTVVCPDLRGYGRSGVAVSSPDHEPYSKRAMARDVVNVMASLGFSRFSVAGHDRGGRVAYRLALDHPEHVERLAVLDVIPTAEVWNRADARFALAFWPWSLLAQEEPLPERLLAADPRAIVEAAVTGWGTPPDAFDDQALDAYIETFRNPASVHAICEEYRAAATIDRDHDEADRRAGRRIRFPVLVLWSDRGPLAQWYQGAGGPIGIWQEWADDVHGQALNGGHFFPEELPEATAAALRAFFGGGEA